jgi:uncharacterized protein YecT (DUF1311 family)
MVICKSLRTESLENRSNGLVPILRAAVFAAALCFVCPLTARPGVQTTGSTDCKDAATTAAMRTCENARYQKAEQDLNAAFNELMRELDADQKSKLRLAQSAWTRFREANADFEAATVRGGTLAPLLKVSTLADMTEARVAELKKEEGQ